MPKPKLKKYNHKKNIITETASRPSKLQPGHIIRFNYSGKNVTSKKPLVLVLNPKFKGQLHGINLDYIPEGTLSQLWKMVDITLQGKIAKLVKLNLPLLKADIGNPRAFYNSRLKKFLKSKLGSTGVAYRTYDSSKLGSVRIIDYRFKGSSYADDVRDKAEEELKKK